MFESFQKAFLAIVAKFVGWTKWIVHTHEFFIDLPFLVEFWKQNGERLEQTFVLAHARLYTQQETRRIKRTSRKRTAKLHVWFLVCIAARRPGRKAFREFFQLGNPVEYSSGTGWPASIQSALFHFRDCCFK